MKDALPFPRRHSSRRLRSISTAGIFHCFALQSQGQPARLRHAARGLRNPAGRTDGHRHVCGITPNPKAKPWQQDEGYGNKKPAPARPAQPDTPAPAETEDGELYNPRLWTSS